MGCSEDCLLFQTSLLAANAFSGLRSRHTTHQFAPYIHRVALSNSTANRAAQNQDQPQPLQGFSEPTATYFANFLKPMALFLVGVPLTPFQTWVFQGSG